MNVDIENITSKNKHLGDQYTTLVIIHFFSEAKLFSTGFLDQCRNNPNGPQNIPNRTKTALKKNGYGTGVVCTSGYDPPKGVRE